MDWFSYVEPTLHSCNKSDLVMVSNAFLKSIYLFIFGCTGSWFLQVVASQGYSLLRCTGFSLWWLLLQQSTGFRHTGFSIVPREFCSCGRWPPGFSGSRVHRFCSYGTWALVAPQHAESFWTRNWTCIPCIGRQILIHCATKKVP